MSFSNIDVARILSAGVHFFCPKRRRPFFSCRSQIPSKYTSKSKPPNKNCPKNWLLLWLGGCTSCPGGALAHFSCKLGLKIFFYHPRGAGAPTATPWLYLCSVNSKWHQKKENYTNPCRRWWKKLPHIQSTQHAAPTRWTHVTYKSTRDFKILEVVHEQNQLNHR